MTRTLSTAPARLNSSVSSSSVHLYGRLPTYNLRPIAARPSHAQSLSRPGPCRRASNATPGSAVGHVIAEMLPGSQQAVLKICTACENYRELASLVREQWASFPFALCISAETRLCVLAARDFR